jgi:hypothetical protein
MMASVLEAWTKKRMEDYKTALIERDDALTSYAATLAGLIVNPAKDDKEGERDSVDYQAWCWLKGCAAKCVTAKASLDAIGNIAKAFSAVAMPVLQVARELRSMCLFEVHDGYDGISRYGTSKGTRVTHALDIPEFSADTITKLMRANHIADATGLTVVELAFKEGGRGVLRMWELPRRQPLIKIVAPAAEPGPAAAVKPEQAPSAPPAAAATN